MHSAMTVACLLGAFASGYFVWATTFRHRYMAAKRTGGPEWLKTERVTVIVVGAASFAGYLGSYWMLIKLG